MKLYDCIYVNGDSYSALNKDTKVYSEYLSERLNIPVVNNACAGCSNSRIIRSTVEDIIKLKTQYTNILVIIGFSFVTRDEIWLEDDDKFSGKIPDKENYPNSRFITSRALAGSWDKLKDRIHDLNINRQVTHFYTQLFTLTNTFENMGIDYFIFSAAHNHNWGNINWDYVNSLEQVKKCLSNPKIYKFHDFSTKIFAEENNFKTTDTYHLLTDGHYGLSSFLLDKLKNL